MEGKLFLTREEIDKGLVIKEGNDPYWSNRPLILFTNNEYFITKHHITDEAIIAKFDDLDCKGYAFRGIDEKGYHYIGLYISKSVSDFSYLCALFAHESRHIVDYVMEDAYERLIYGLEIPAYLQEQIVYELMENINYELLK